MNEEQKNIETCLPENILSEVANVPTDPQFRSLVEESFDPLKQQAAAQAGYDGYEKVVWTHKPYTFTSSVKQMKSNLILLLRRLWRFPFGMGTLRSLADMWQHYITRLKGNPEYGIPSRLDQLTDLPAAPALLEDRKISNGDNTPDGISLLHILSDSSLNVTEYYDNNEGWNMDTKLPVFSSALVATINCKSTNVSIGSCFPNAEIINLPSLEYVGYYPILIDFHSSPLRELLLPSLRSCGALICGAWYWEGTIPNLTELNLPALTNIRKTRNYQYMAFIGSQCPNLQTISIPNLERMEWFFTGGFCLEGLRKLHLPKLVYLANLDSELSGGGLVTPMNRPSGNLLKSLIHFEIGEVASNLNLKDWSAEYALDASRTDLIEEGSTAQNNLQQFLENFRSYIALRLTDKGSGKTLTLSQAVRNAIHAAEGEYGIENIIITQKGWTISPAPN